MSEGKQVLKFDPNGKFSVRYNSVSEAAKFEGRDRPVVQHWLKVGHDKAGNLWRFAGAMK